LNPGLAIRWEFGNATTFECEIPCGDIGGRMDLRVGMNPIGNLLIGRAGGNEGLELVRIQSGKFQENAVDSNIVFILARGAIDLGPAIT